MLLLSLDCSNFLGFEWPFLISINIMSCFPGRNIVKTITKPSLDPANLFFVFKSLWLDWLLIVAIINLSLLTGPLPSLNMLQLSSAGIHFSQKSKDSFPNFYFQSFRTTCSCEKLLSIFWNIKAFLNNLVFSKCTSVELIWLFSDFTTAPDFGEFKFNWFWLILPWLFMAKTTPFRSTEIRSCPNGQEKRLLRKSLKLRQDKIEII